MSNNPSRNIVLITIDSLRADYAGYLNADCDATPTLSDMAQEGIGFERAIAPGPSTPESMPAIFTGHYPINDSTPSEGLAGQRSRISRHLSSRNTLAERLSRLGYSTAGFTPNPFTSRFFGFDHGFDHFQDFMGDDRKARGLYDRIFRGFLNGDPTSSIARVLLNFWQREEVFKPWESYYDELIEWASTADEPYFIWVFLMDAHNPYLPDPAYRSQSRLAQFHANFRFWWESHETPFSPAVHDRLVTAYGDAVTYSDAFLNRLRADIDADDPVMAVHGDHGEAFGEHGSYGHEPYLHPENVHVPLVIEGVARPETVGDPVSLRKLPEMLETLTTGTLEVGDWPRYATTRTLQGSAAAVYTANRHFINDEAVGDVPANDASQSIRSIFYRAEEFRREKRRIRDAVTEVATT